MKILYYIVIFFLILQSCTKETSKIGEDPYAGGKEQLKMKFKPNVLPNPTSGNPGDLVVFRVDGLAGYNSDDIQFYFNEELGEIINKTDSTLQVRVPNLVSTGGVSVVVDGEAIFGPKFTVKGKVNVDPNFFISTGFQMFAFPLIGGTRTDGSVNDYLEYGANQIIYGGYFTDYNSLATLQSPLNGLVSLNQVGSLNTGFKSNYGLEGVGAVNSLIKLTDGSIVIGGVFSKYDKNPNMGNLTKIKSNGALDTMSIRVINDTNNPLKSLDTVPTFNGSVLGSVTKLFNTTVGGVEKIIAVGNFTDYYKFRYDYRPTADFKFRDFTNISSVIRMEVNGKLDSSYNFNAGLGRGLGGANGIINNAAIQEDGKVIIVGRFTSFHGTPVNNIVRVDQNGQVDDTFNIGSGANNTITSIQRANNKIVLTGAFSSFNGIACNGVVMLNLDGSVDQSFQFLETDGGTVYYAKKLTNGKVFVSGSFSKYDGIKRGGMLILEADGTALQAYNNIGSFEGIVYNVRETTSSSGFYSLAIMGAIRRFDNNAVRGMVVIELKN